MHLNKKLLEYFEVYISWLFYTVKNYTIHITKEFYIGNVLNKYLQSETRERCPGETEIPRQEQAY